MTYDAPSLITDGCATPLASKPDPSPESDLAPGRPGRVVGQLRRGVLGRRRVADRPRSARAETREEEVIRPGVVEHARIALAAVVEGGLIAQRRRARRRRARRREPSSRRCRRSRSPLRARLEVAPSRAPVEAGELRRRADRSRDREAGGLAAVEGGARACRRRTSSRRLRTVHLVERAPVVRRREADPRVEVPVRVDRVARVVELVRRRSAGVLEHVGAVQVRVVEVLGRAGGVEHRAGPAPGNPVRRASCP